MFPLVGSCQIPLISCIFYSDQIPLISCIFFRSNSAHSLHFLFRSNSAHFLHFFLSIPLIPVKFRSFRSSLAFFERNLSGLLDLGYVRIRLVNVIFFFCLNTVFRSSCTRDLTAIYDINGVKSLLMQT